MLSERRPSRAQVRQPIRLVAMEDPTPISFGAPLAVIIGGAVLTGILAIAAAFYLVLKRHTLSPEVRAALVQELDAADRVTTSIYEYMIYAAIAGMTGLAVFFYLVLEDDPWRDFLIFYGGVVYLIGMLWAIGQLWYVRRRRRGEMDPRSILSVLPQLQSKIEFKVETAEPQMFSLDDAALEQAQQHVAAGGTIDEACALVIPQYAGMNGIMKGILRKAVEAALAARQS